MTARAAAQGFTDEKVFRPKASAILGTACLSLLFGGVIGGALYLAISQPEKLIDGELIAFILTLLLFGSMFLVSVYYLLWMTCSYTISSRGITARGLLVSWRADWRDVVTLDTSATAGQSYDLVLKSGATVTVPFKVLSNGYRLRQLVEQHAAAVLEDQPVRSRTIHHLKMRGFAAAFFAGIGVLIGFALFYQGGPSLVSALAGLVIAAPFPFLGWYCWRVHFLRDGDLLHQFSVRAKPPLRISTLERVRLSCSHERDSWYEALELVGTSAKVTVASSYTNYIPLRDYVLKHATSAEIIDDRPREDR